MKKRKTGCRKGRPLRQRRRLTKKGGVKTADRYAMSCFGTRRVPEESYRIQVTGAAALQSRSSLRGSFHPFPLADEKINAPVRCGSRRTGLQPGGTPPAAFQPGRRQYQ